MSRNSIETIMGGVVLLIAASFLVTAYQSKQLKTVSDGFSVSAKFDDASGIVSGSDVRIGGVKVGVVDSLTLDNKTYRAIVKISLANAVRVPSDSAATIKSDGLLGGKFISVDPGGSDELLADGGVIEFTQSSISLEEMIGKFVFSGGGVDGKDDEGEKKGAPTASKDKSDDVELSVP